MKRKMSFLLAILIISTLGFVTIAGLSACKEKEFDQELVFIYREKGRQSPQFDGYGHEFSAGLFLTSGSRPNSKGEVVIPNYVDGQPVVGIDHSAFRLDDGRVFKFYNNELKKITIPKNVEVINEIAFSGFENLEEVIFDKDSNLLAISQRAFRDTPKLRNIILPDKLEFIGWSAFENSGIESLKIPKGVKQINNATFADCGNLTSIILHNELKVIERHAFTRTTKVESIIIPSSVIRISIIAFVGWTNEQTIYIEHENCPDTWVDWSLDFSYVSANIVWGYTGY